MQHATVASTPTRTVAVSGKATASTSAIQTPQASPRGQIPIEPAAPPAPTSRDFVPWRFSDAAGRSAWMASSCRRPRNLHKLRHSCPIGPCPLYPRYRKRSRVRSAKDAEPNEMSVAGDVLLGMTFKTRVDGQYMEALSDKPGDICHNLAALNDNLWLAVYINGAKPHWRPAVSVQSLWFSKGEAGQRAFVPYSPRGKRHLRRGLEARFAIQADRPNRHDEAIVPSSSAVARHETSDLRSPWEFFFGSQRGMSVCGTFGTCRRTLKMSVCRGRPELLVRGQKACSRACRSSFALACRPLSRCFRR
jgi:hypothetical protein